MMTRGNTFSSDNPMRGKAALSVHSSSDLSLPAVKKKNKKKALKFSLSSCGEESAAEAIKDHQRGNWEDLKSCHSRRIMRPNRPSVKELGHKNIFGGLGSVSFARLFSAHILMAGGFIALLFVVRDIKQFENMYWTFVTAFACDVTIVWALITSLAPAADIVHRKLWLKFITLILLFATLGAVGVSWARSKEDALGDSLTQKDAYLKDTDCMWIDYEISDPAVLQSMRSFCPQSQKFPTVRPSKDRITTNRSVILAKFNLIAELYDGIEPYIHDLNEFNKPGYDKEGCFEAIENVACFFVLPPCNSECDVVKPCRSLCDDIYNKCPAVKGAIAAFESHPDIFMGVLSTTVDPIVGRAFTNILINSLKHFSVQGPADIQEQHCGGFKYPPEQTECAKGNVLHYNASNGRCSKKAKAAHNALLGRESSNPVSLARYYMIATIAACFCILFALSAVEVRYYQKQSRNRESLGYIAEMLGIRGLGAVALLLVLAGVLAFFAAIFDGYQLKYIRSGAPATCINAENTDAVLLFSVDDSVVWGSKNHQKRIGFRDQLVVASSTWWIHVLTFLAIYRALGRQWPWVWRFNRSKRKKREKSSQIELTETVKETSADSQMPLSEKPKRLKRVKKFIAKSYKWYKKTFSYRYGEFFVEKQYFFFILGVMLQYTFIRSQTEFLDYTQVILFALVLALHMIIASALLSQRNPLYSRDVLLVFESLVDTFYVCFNGTMLRDKLLDRESRLDKFIAISPVNQFELSRRFPNVQQVTLVDSNQYNAVPLSDVHDDLRIQLTSEIDFCMLQFIQAVALAWPIVSLVRTLSRVSMTLAKGKAKSQRQSSLSSRSAQRLSPRKRLFPKKSSSGGGHISQGSVSSITRTIARSTTEAVTEVVWMTMRARRFIMVVLALLAVLLLGSSIYRAKLQNQYCREAISNISNACVWERSSPKSLLRTFDFRFRPESRSLENCGLNRVHKLNLTRCNMAKIPDALYSLFPNLRVFDVSDNPDLKLLEETPYSLFRRLKGLRSIFAQNVGLQKVPVSFACIDPKRVKFELQNFSRIRKLDWSDLNCTLEITPCEVLSALVHAEHVDLSRNNIATLDLNRCDKFLQKNDALRVLNVSRNGIKTLNISKVLKLESLSVIDLSSNDIVTLPTGLASWYADGCQINGKVAVNQAACRHLLYFSNCPKINSVYWQSRNLTYLPSDMSTLTGAIHVDLLNNLIRELPDLTRSASTLEYLNIQVNKYLPRFPDEVRHLTRLADFRSGLFLAKEKDLIEIPKWLFSLKNISVLELEYSGLKGSFPTEFCTMMNLRVLDLTSNSFTGTVPSCMRQLEKLEEFRVIKMDVTRIPTEMALLPKLKTLAIGRGGTMEALFSGGKENFPEINFSTLIYDTQGDSEQHLPSSWMRRCARDDVECKPSPN